jgi:hypothetical protein
MDSDLNGNKHSPNLTHSKFRHERNFDISMSFQNIWTNKTSAATTTTTTTTNNNNNNNNNNKRTKLRPGGGLLHLRSAKKLFLEVSCLRKISGILQEYGVI